MSFINNYIFLKNIFYSGTICVLLTCHSWCQAGFIKLLQQALPGSVKPSLTLSNTVIERQQRLNDLRLLSEKTRLKHETKIKTINNNISDIEKKIQLIKQETADNSSLSNEHTEKQIAILNESHQILLSTLIAIERTNTLIREYITLLEDYLQDPYFEKISVNTKAVYNFKDYLKHVHKLVGCNEKIQLLKEQIQQKEHELKTSSQLYSSSKQDYEAKNREQQEFSSSYHTQNSIHQATLIDLQKEHFSYEKRLQKLKTYEYRYDVEVIGTVLAIEHEKRKIFKQNVDAITHSLRIDQKDIAEARHLFEEHKKNFIVSQQGHYNNIKEVTQQKNQLSQTLDTFRREHKSSLDQNATLFSDISSYTIDDNLGLNAQAGMYKEQIRALESRIDLLNALIELEKIKHQYEKNNVDILVSWSELTARKSTNKDEASKKLKEYQNVQNDYARKLSNFKEKKTSVVNLLDILHKNLATIKTNSYEIQKASVDKKNDIHSALAIYQFFEQAQQAVSQEIAYQTQLLQSYAAMIDAVQNNNQQINTIVIQLEKKSIWQRSEYAVSLRGILNSWSDFSYFINDIYFLINTYEFNSLIAELKHIGGYTGNITLFLIKIVLSIGFLVFMFIGTKLLLYRVINKAIFQSSRSIIRQVARVLFSFIYRFYTSIFIWIILFTLFCQGIVTDQLFEICFYLCSIPYLCYLTYCLTRYVNTFNQENNYSLYKIAHQKRFLVIGSLFGYSSAILLLLREAFIAGMYYTSEIPAILLAIYSITVRTLILFSIGREELFLLIPAKGMLNKSLGYIIEHYYYLIISSVLLIMMISDPYVGGYSNLVWYIMWGCIGSFFVIRTLLWIQAQIKQISTHLFMYTDDEALKERFAHARTWYGVFMVVLWLVFFILCIVLCLKIWGYATSIEDIHRWFEYDLFTTGQDEMGRYIKFTPKKFFVAIGIILAGFIASIAMNRFIVSRVFELVPVDVGVQHMVSSLTHYMVLVVAIFIGFQWAGLGTLLIAIGLIIGSITYLVREPLADFLSYFILLVQRPVKIGDLVMIGDELGFVRHITPRSVILRAKNSYTLIVPNASIISQSLKNWNYSGGYVAFEDIKLTIGYTVDPLKVKEIIYNLLVNSQRLLKIPAPIVRLDNFGEHGYEFLIRGFISSERTAEIWETASEVRLQIVQTLRMHEIGIAVPVRTVTHISPSNKAKKETFSSPLNIEQENDLED